MPTLGGRDVAEVVDGSAGRLLITNFEIFPYWPKKSLDRMIWIIIKARLSHGIKNYNTLVSTVLLQWHTWDAIQ